MKSIFIDTSVFYAVLNKKDKYHKKAKEFFLTASKRNLHFITSNFVVAETHALLLNRVGRDIALLWLKAVPAIIVRATETDEERAKEIILTYMDKDFSYCDTVSFSIIERLSIEKVLAFDKHFKAYGKFSFVF